MTQDQGFRFQDFYEPPARAASPQEAPAPGPERPAQPAQQPQAQPAAPMPAQPQTLQPQALQPQPEQPQEPRAEWQERQAPPVIAPGAWTGMQRAGWFLIGALGGPLGILVSSMTNVGNPYRSEATKMAAIGFAAMIVLGLLATIAGTAAYLSMLSSIATAFTV